LISADEARRMALVAQGFAEPRPSGRVDARHLRRVIDRVGVLQLDSVNVLCRSHYLPVFSRLGPYPRAVLDRMAWGNPRELFEYSAHKASLLPVQSHPLQRWRMEAALRHLWGGDLKRWRSVLDPAILLAPWAVIEGMWRLAAEQPDLVDDVLAIVTERGPVSAGDVGITAERRLQQGGLWNWNDVKVALEWLFYCGTVTTATRRNFERIYDLTERVVPAEILSRPTPNRADAQRELMRIAARAYGIATERELRDYFHLPAAHSKARVAELVESGELLPVRVEGLAQRMYRWSGARALDAVHARALLSPFDSLIWSRDRTLRLFDFHYRIGIYTPAAKRTHGYYVLPFLLGDRLVARVDLKADRQASTLVVPEAHLEPGNRGSMVAAELADELWSMATWLELDHVVVKNRGDLSRPLTRAVRAAR
jgi:hypothetical protein